MVVFLAFERELQFLGKNLTLKVDGVDDADFGFAPRRS